MTRAGIIDLAPLPILAMAVNALGAWHRVTRYSRRMRQTLASWRKLERLSKDELTSLQVQRLQKILKRAATTKFYGRRFADAGFDPAGLRAPEDLVRVPFLDRSDLLHHFEDMIVPGSRLFSVKKRSSGTTGQPVTFLQPHYMAFEARFAMLYQFYAWHGVAPLVRRATLAGRYLGSRDGGVAIHNIPEKQLLLGVHALSRSNVGIYVAAMQNFSPSFLQAHPSAMLLLRTLIVERGLEAPRIPVVTFTGENLLESERQELMEWFGGTIFGTYGSGENHLAAGECPNLSGYHLHPMVGAAEIVRSERGTELVGTSLLNDVMPLIRYKTGDLVDNIDYRKCACGCTWPRITGLQGRIDDTIFGPSGEVIPAVVLRTGIAKKFKVIPPYSLVQNTSLGSFTLRIYSDEVPSANSFTDVRTYIADLLGQGVCVGIEILPSSAFLNNRAKHKIVVKE